MTTRHPEWEAEILEMMDQAASKYDFPLPDNANFYYGTMRLTAFRSDSEWLIVFDSVLYSPGTGDFRNDVVAFGNKLQKSGTQDAYAPRQSDGIGYSRVFSKSARESFRLHEDGQSLLDKFSFEMPINGVTRSFHPTRDDYDSAGIDVDSEMPLEVQILRYLVYKLGEELYETPERLLEICGRREADLKQWIQLSEWHHPGPDPDDLPSETSTFQSLAQALVAGDSELYEVSEESNTHWSNWTALERWRRRKK